MEKEVEEYPLKESDIKIVRSKNYLAARVGKRVIVIYSED